MYRNKKLCNKQVQKTIVVVQHNRLVSKIENRDYFQVKEKITEKTSINKINKQILIILKKRNNITK